MEPPLVSIVTPCLNTARFIEKTITSVLTQDHSRIEYIVMDGGSDDGTLKILERYRSRLQYESAPDGGAADAVNRGFAKSKGAIFAWINADDEYLPGALRTAVRCFLDHPEADVVYGGGIWTDENGKELGRYPTVAPYRAGMLQQECTICQPAAFVRREAMEGVGLLNPGLRASFDYDLWIRLAKRYRFMHVTDYLATSRMHRENKTLSQRRTVFTESIALLVQHYGYVPVSWVYGYLSFLRDRRDQFFEPLQHSILTYLAALPVGLKYNHRHPVRYAAEWMSALKPSSLRQLRTPGDGFRSGLE